MNELRYRVTELENEKLQYEKKLQCTKVSSHGKVVTLATLTGSVSPVDFYLPQPRFASPAKVHLLCCWLNALLNLSHVLLYSSIAIWHSLANDTWAFRWAVGRAAESLQLWCLCTRCCCQRFGVLRHVPILVFCLLDLPYLSVFPSLLSLFLASCLDC